MANQEPPAPEPLQSSLEATPSRRTMIREVVTGILSFVLIAIPATLGGLFFLDPVLRKRSAANGSGNGDGNEGELEGFIPVPVTASSLPDDGTPVLVTVKDDLDDAWNRFIDVPIGNIWLRKNQSGDLVAFNSICPHLGCRVSYREGKDDFFCPCHTSAFDLNGSKTNEIPPRGMDSLQVVRVQDGVRDPSGDEIRVRYRNFRIGTRDKIPV